MLGGGGGGGESHGHKLQINKAQIKNHRFKNLAITDSK